MRKLAEKMCEIGQRAYQRHVVGGTEGNFSVRFDEEHVLCTPTLLCKDLLTPDDLCVIDLDGRQLSGKRQRSSEMLMHVGMYRAAPAVRAIIHAHPPFATTFAVLGEAGFSGILPEGDVFLGAVPLIPYETPGTREMASALVPHLKDANAAILQNHGTVAWAGDLETAYALTETLEALCRVVHQARQIGTVHTIPPEKREELAAIRARWLRSVGMG